MKVINKSTIPKKMTSDCKSDIPPRMIFLYLQDYEVTWLDDPLYLAHGQGGEIEGREVGDDC